MADKELTQNLLSRIDYTDSCWIWMGSYYQHGYGKYHHLSAHRGVYELLVGTIPEGLHLDHLCRNTGCVNPDHLEAVTPRTNILRGVGITAKNAVKTHCVNNHEFNQRNTYRRKDRANRRECRTCRAASVRKNKLKLEASLG